MTTIYYHVAAMGHWRSILQEQLRQISRCKSPAKIKIGFTGPRDEVGYIWRCAYHLGLEFEVVFSEAGNDQFEFPTLKLLKSDCDAGLKGNVIYIHSKGASRGGDWHSTMWRWLMNAHMLSSRAKSLAHLRGKVAWVSPVVCGFGTRIPAYPCGNFWAAKADHIRKLPPVDKFRSEFLDKWVESDCPHWVTERHAAEMWLGAVKATTKALITPEFEIGSERAFACNPEMQDYATIHGS